VDPADTPVDPAAQSESPAAEPEQSTPAGPESPADQPGSPAAPAASPWAPRPGVPAGYPQPYPQSAAFGPAAPHQTAPHQPGDPFATAPYPRPYSYQGYTAAPGFGTAHQSTGASTNTGASAGTPPFAFGTQPPFDPQPTEASHADKRHTKGARATVVAVAVAALALGAGFGGGMIGGSLSNDSSGAAAATTLAPRATGQSASDTSGTQAALGSVQDVAAKVLPSVVSVVALTQQGEGEGSGVVLTDSGLIHTNNHVIDGADTLTVQFNDGTIADANVVGADPTDDLAVIRASGVSGLTPAKLGTSSTVKVGQQVVAIGSPLGLSATVTTGIVSALNRPVRTQSAESQQQQGTVLSAIQTDAAINPGNSGGPLVNMSGQVIGINSAIAALSSGAGGQSGSIGVGFAIPIDQAYRIAQEIINTGSATHAVLGANVTDASDRSRGITTGATIAEVVPKSGAAKAGLKAGDIVTKVDSVPIESADALVATIRSSAPGGTISLTYVRNGQSHTVSVTLGSSGK
jgi:putative serine protease PepD